MQRPGLATEVVDTSVYERAVQRFREQRIVMPTFAQLAEPMDLAPEVAADVAAADPDAPDPRNLFRVHWHNAADRRSFAAVPDHLVLPRELTGVEAPIVVALADRFPMIASHKVLAAYACLAPRIVTGQFDPSSQRAVWPSTGNYCRGGVAISRIMGCRGVAVLPEGMSQERFDWLSTIAGEVIKTPGSESNVKEIFDKCWELRRSGQDLVIFNQFDELGNYLWHHEITGRAMAEVLESELGPHDRYRGVALTTGSAGTIASGDYLKKLFPDSKIAASEALQCPTLLENGFGAHRIEGIGDKHVPWVHNVRNTDLVMAIDDEAIMAVIRLFNEPAGKAYLAKIGVPEALISQLGLLGISGILGGLLAGYFILMFEALRLTDPVSTGAVFTLTPIMSAGFGWLRPEGVRRELEKMAARWREPPSPTCSGARCSSPLRTRGDGSLRAWRPSWGSGCWWNPGSPA